MDCPSCHEYVHSETHLCFIQRAPKPQDKKKRKRKHQGGPRAKRGAAAAEPDTTPEEEEDDDLPPLHVFFDIEAMQPDEQHIANLLVAETEDDDQPMRFPGPSCTRDFLEWLDTLTLNDTRQVNVLAHNFQGYDGYFVVQQYHSDNRIVQQLRNGCKLLEVQARPDPFHRFPQFLPDAFVRLSQNLWINGIEKRLLPPQVQYPHTPKLRGHPSRPSITTCPKPCLLKASKPWKRGIKNNAR